MWFIIITLYSAWKILSDDNVDPKSTSFTQGPRRAKTPFSRNTFKKSRQEVDVHSYSWKVRSGGAPYDYYEHERLGGGLGLNIEFLTKFPANYRPNQNISPVLIQLM